MTLYLVSAAQQVDLGKTLKSVRGGMCGIHCFYLICSSSEDESDTDLGEERSTDRREDHTSTMEAGGVVK